MNPRITSIENSIAYDPGGRNIFGLLIADQLRLAGQSLRLARRVGIVSGFYIPEAGKSETDGPPGAKIIGQALGKLGIEVDYITDRFNVPAFRALGLEPIVEPHDYLDSVYPTHMVSVERLGRGMDGRYRNMNGVDVSETTAPLDSLFLDAGRRGITTIGIGDGGNEIGMGKVFADALTNIRHGRQIVTTVATDFCIVAGVSNWGAYGLAGALSVLSERDLLSTAGEAARDIEQLVEKGAAVDGVTHASKPTVDGIDLAVSIRMLENIRDHIAPSPLARGVPLLVGVLGYGETGRAAAALLTQRGHRVCISEMAGVTVDRGSVFAGVETGGHTIDFLGKCDLVVASPGVRADSPIRDQLHRRGIPVVSELEMAYQLCDRSLIGVTGTAGKRTTIELLERLFHQAGRSLSIGGNKGKPLSELLVESATGGPIALAISSFQLETVVHFRPDLAVILNVREAHLDRHQTVSEYVRIKSRVFMNQSLGSAGESSDRTPVHSGVLILPFDEPRLRVLARKHRGWTLYVSSRQEVDRGAWLSNGELHFNIDGRQEQAEIFGRGAGAPEIQFPENLLASTLAARLFGLTVDEIAGGVHEAIQEGVQL